MPSLRDGVQQWRGSAGTRADSFRFEQELEIEPMTADWISGLCASVAAGALMRHLEEFAKRVKLSGTPEELESFRYLQATLDGYGYKTNLILHDAYISLPGRAKIEIESDTHDC